MALRLRPAALACMLLVSGAVIAACGSGSTSTPTPSPTGPSTPGASATPVPPLTPPPSATPSGPTYSVQVALTGTDTVQGTFTQGTGQCQAPGTLSGLVSGQQVTLLMPGSNTSGQAVQLSPGDLQVTVGGHVWFVASASNAPHGTAGTLQRNANGSGSAQFQNLALQGNSAQQPQESGTITWTCA